MSVSLERRLNDVGDSLMDRLDIIWNTTDLSKEDFLRAIGRTLGGDIEDMYFNWLTEGES